MSFATRKKLFLVFVFSLFFFPALVAMEGRGGSSDKHYISERVVLPALFSVVSAANSVVLAVLSFCMEGTRLKIVMGGSSFCFGSLSCLTSAVTLSGCVMSYQKFWRRNHQLYDDSVVIPTERVSLIGNVSHVEKVNLCKAIQDYTQNE